MQAQKNRAGWYSEFGLFRAALRRMMTWPSGITRKHRCPRSLRIAGNESFRIFQEKNLTKLHYDRLQLLIA